MPQCHYHFFDVVLLLLIYHLPHLSFVFSVSRQGSLELCIHFRCFGMIDFLSVILRCFFNHSFFFYYLLKCFLNVTQICMYSSRISHLCSKFVPQERVLFSDRSLRHYELGMLKAVQIVHYFIPNLASCNASFLCLEWFKNENLPTKNIVMLFNPLQVGSKDKNKMLMLIFFLFVLHVVCIFFYCKQNPFWFTKYARHFHKHKLSRDYNLLSVIFVEFHHIHC